MTTLILVSLAGCATRNWNDEIDAPTSTEAVRHCTPRGNASELFVVLAFSGGGMRSAAMSYGLLEALRDKTIRIGGQEHRLIDEVDVITSVSGGSYTAAYYGLFGDRIFKDYESIFLKRDVQGELIAALVNPHSLASMASTDFNRGDLAAAWFDANIFEHQPFSSMRGQDRPCIIVNASDLNTGLTFSFVQQQFDFLCSNLDRYPVANAVTASSAMPIVFAPITVRNHARDCEARHKRWVTEALSRQDRETSTYQARQLEHYLSPADMPLVRLVDGGVTDNLGIRGSIMSPILHMGDITTMAGAFTPQSLDQVTQVLVVISNAQAYRPYAWSKNGTDPGIVSTTPRRSTRPSIFSTPTPYRKRGAALRTGPRWSTPDAVREMPKFVCTLSALPLTISRTATNESGSMPSPPHCRWTTTRSTLYGCCQSSCSKIPSISSALF